LYAYATESLRYSPVFGYSLNGVSSIAVFIGVTIGRKYSCVHFGVNTAIVWPHCNHHHDDRHDQAIVHEQKMN
jgi:hypothetical protein